MLKMKPKNLNLIILIILLTFCAGLFVYGESVIEKAKQSFVSVGFSQSQNSADFSFFIDNKNNKRNAFELNFLINEKLFFQQKIELAPGEKRFLKLPQKIHQQIYNDKTGQQSTLEIVIKNKEKTGKWTLKRNL